MNLSKAFTKREKVLMTILAVLLVAAVYFLAVHRPVTEELDRIRAETQAADSELVVLQAKAKRLSDMKAELEEILADPHAAVTPQYDNLKQLMTFLNTVMAGTRDYDISFQTQLPGEEGSVVRRTASMRFVCASYADARAIIEALRDCPWRCLANDLSITPAGEQRAKDDRPITEGPVQVSLTVTFFESVK